ncbi:MAG: sigma-70 family RNA polymerase sigma factor [Anaerolineaceae bacterium]|nr:sigma-70 family RNA polymerase sigma factor [Anaerolineaceae bacterium]
MNEKKRELEEIDIAKLQKGDREEFAKFVDNYSGIIYGLILKIVKDATEAEDILQETFIKVLKNLKGFEGRSSLSTWLYRIATNEALMYLRKQKMIFNFDDNSNEDMEDFDVIDWCCLPEKEMISSETQEYLMTAVEKLSLSLQLVFHLRDLDGLSVRETAMVLDISESAVKTRLSRARMQLRNELTNYFNIKFDLPEEVAHA